MNGLAGQPCERPLAFGLPAHSGADRGGRRVLFLLPAIWVLNLTDVLFTMLATGTGYFVELNPLARRLGTSGQVVFKLAGLLFCTAVFCLLRRRRTVEWGCYVLVAVYGGLAAIWLTLYGFLLSRFHFELLFAGG